MAFALERSHATPSSSAELSLDDARVRLEGELETIEAAHAVFSSLREALATRRWRSHIASLRGTLEQASFLAGQLPHALEAFDRRAKIESWSADITKLGHRCKQVQSSLEKLVRRRVVETLDSQTAKMPLSGGLAILASKSDQLAEIRLSNALARAYVLAFLPFMLLSADFNHLVLTVLIFAAAAAVLGFTLRPKFWRRNLRDESAGSSKRDSFRRAHAQVVRFMPSNAAGTQTQGFAGQLTHYLVRVDLMLDIARDREGSRKLGTFKSRAEARELAMRAAKILELPLQELDEEKRVVNSA